MSQAIGLVDLGGTRTKRALWTPRNLQIDIFPTPSSRQDFVRIADQWDCRWALALPGKWDHKKEVWLRPSVWGEGVFSGEEIRSWFSRPPEYVTNDLSAAAEGCGGNSAFLQISTGVGARLTEDGQLLFSGSEPLGADFRNEIWQGRPLWQWLSLREAQSWLPRSRRGLSWRELGQSPPEELVQAAQYFVDLLFERFGKPVVLLGGGALALRPYLRRASWPAFYQPGLRGLWRGLSGATNKMEAKAGILSSRFVQEA